MLASTVHEVSLCVQATFIGITLGIWGSLSKDELIPLLQIGRHCGRFGGYCKRQNGQKKKKPYPLGADTVEEGGRCQANTLWKYSSDEVKGYGEK